jgi:hypothetical protein
VALAIESYRARVVAAPLLPTAAIELSELTETAQPPPLPMSAVPSELQATLYSRGQGARVPSYLGSRARGGASDHDSLPSDEGQLCRSHPRLSTWSPRRGLWIAAALLGVGVVAPVAGQLWRPAADAHARSAPAAPAFGKTADVSALTKKDKPVAAAPTARRSTTRSTAIGSSPAKGESRVPSLPRGVDLSMSESESLMVARPRQGLVSDRVGEGSTALVSESAEAALSTVPPAAQATLPVSAGSEPAAIAQPSAKEDRLEPRTVQVRREPFNARALERNPYLRR